MIHIQALFYGTHEELYQLTQTVKVLNQAKHKRKEIPYEIRILIPIDIICRKEHLPKVLTWIHQNYPPHTSIKQAIKKLEENVFTMKMLNRIFKAFKAKPLTFTKKPFKMKSPNILCLALREDKANEKGEEIF